MKVGMLPYYDKWAVRHAVTVLQLDHCHVVQVKTKEIEGYTALQVGVGTFPIIRLNRPTSSS
jgi:large subunit ribosomal protein L3